MKWLLLLVVSLVIATGPVADDDGASELGVGTGIILPSGDENPCPPSELFCNHDGSFIRADLLKGKRPGFAVRRLSRP